MTSDRLEGLGVELDAFRHADGSIDIAVLGRVAHEQRLTAMHASIRDFYNAVRSFVPGRELAPKQTLSGKPC